ncbi:CoA-binding protein [Chloroflexota bacterium]
MVSDKLDGFASIFCPESHAIVGASADTRKYGGRFLRVLLSFGYSENIYPVNPQESQILGPNCFERRDTISLSGSTN